MLLLLLLLLNNLLVESSSISSIATDSRSKRNSNDVKRRLVFAHVIFRHGDRTPIKPYPTDPWKNVKDWPNEFGQLTNIGKQQHYALGQWLRKRYDGLLSPIYSNDEIYIRSTDKDRTLMSAQSNLAGLYPPTGDDKFDAGIAWQPIPVHTVPEKLDIILARAKCSVYDNEKSMVKHLPEFNKNNESYAYLYKYLTEHVGYEVKTITDIEHINNTLYIESLYDKTLPEWTKKVYPSADMTYLSVLSLLSSTYTRKMARLKMGSLIKEMLERFDQKAKGKLDPDRNVWIYSAHDSTLVNILNTLKVFDMHHPDYTACIMFELRIDEDHQPFVSLYYKNGPGAEAKTLEIPECGTECPLSKMFSLYEDIIPIDWEDECKRSFFFLVLGVIVMVLAMISFIICIYRGRLI